MRELAKRAIRRLLALRGLAITRLGAAVEMPSTGYISATETVSAAEREGLSVCDYVEKLWGQSGATQRVVDQMASCGAFEAKGLNILEIGTGTGRYLEKVLAKCGSGAARYESYETAADWAGYLQSRYAIVSRDADGVSLGQTPACTVDIVHAHGVFVCLPFLVSYGYWKEIWRVTKRGGFVVFDIISESCADEPTIDKWLASEHRYPCFLSRDYVVSAFGRHGFSLLKTFTNPYGAGRSEYLVFVRTGTAGQGAFADRDSVGAP